VNGAPERGPDYLWDRTGAPDPEVGRLEQLLGSLAHRPASLQLPDAGAGSRDGRADTGIARRAGGRSLRWLLLAAAALLFAGWYFLLRDPGPPPEIRLTAGSDVHTIEGGRHGQKIAMPDIGTITLDPGSRLRVQRFDGNAALFDLQHGRMEAFVYANVPQKFFQVDTAAARCVDMGCKYVLRVDDGGTSHVDVTMGWVAFEFGDRQVFVPHGAQCLAVSGRGPGTPRFLDCPDTLRKAVDRLDALPRARGAERAAAAHAVLAAATPGRDTLCVYHLLSEPDPAVRVAADARLEELVGLPDTKRGVDKRPDPDEWLDFLRLSWW
jgi:hypothetical protein